MSEKVTVSEGARRIGCDERQIRRGIAKGRLHKDSEGLVDLAELRGPWRKEYPRRTAEVFGHSAQMSEKCLKNVRTSRRGGASDIAPPVAAVDGEGGPDLNDPETLGKLDAFVMRLLAGDYADQVEAITIKENALALKHVLAAKREAGSLIELQVAETVLFEEARRARDSWLNWPARAGTLLAARLGVDPEKLIEELAVEVHAQLEQLGEPETDFADAQAEADA